MGPVSREAGEEGKRIVIGYKLLTEDLASASGDHGRVIYSSAMQEITGHGAYLGRTVAGLLRGAYAPILAEIEGEEPTRVIDDGHVITVRRCRILRHVRLDAWVWLRLAIRCARTVAHLSTDPRIEAAIVAAERCERERTPAAATAARSAEEAARNAAEAARCAKLDAIAWLVEEAFGRAKGGSA